MYVKYNIKFQVANTGWDTIRYIKIKKWKTTKGQTWNLNEMITFVIGGCRSGKSSWALEQADRILPDPDKKKRKIFIATSVPTDFEMENRVIKHQKERGKSWQTIESPVNIDTAIKEKSPDATVILVDCLTLWVSNLLFEFNDPTRIEQAVSRLEKALATSSCPVFLVSNEVGYGIVPENSLARQFRDMAGFVNQRIAAAAHRVVTTIAGIDVQIKPKLTDR